MFRAPLLIIFLWIEAALLAAFAIWGGPFWLLPAAGLLALFAALMTRRSAWLGIIFALAASTAWIFSFKPDLSPTLPTAFPVIALIAGTFCAFLGILASLGKIKQSAVFTALGRMVVIFHFLTAGAFLAAGFSPIPLPLAFAWTCCGLAAIFVVDTFFKLISRLYTPRRHWEELAAPGAFFFFHWLGKDSQACFPATRSQDDAFALKLPEMWMWPALRGQLPALAIAALVVTWLGSSLHEISANQSGVRQTAGHWEEKILSPGFHFSLPWPLGVIHRVDTGKIHETVLGFRADPGQPILWERAHYEDEEMSLVGGGDDLLSISVPIHFRIADPAAYLRGAADPERLVRDAGSRILLDLTLRRSAAEVMTH
ncbi:MAG: hypothetical protein HC845_10180, partial [Akkermansiaceae bacterium]|nr:hypothetical protein [Akkermansiaceae bacterium]